MEHYTCNPSLGGGTGSCCEGGYFIRCRIAVSVAYFSQIFKSALVDHPGRKSSLVRRLSGEASNSNGEDGGPAAGQGPECSRKCRQKAVAVRYVTLASWEFKEWVKWVRHGRPSSRLLSDQALWGYLGANKEKGIVLNTFSLSFIAVQAKPPDFLPLIYGHEAS